LTVPLNGKPEKEDDNMFGSAFALARATGGAAGGAGGEMAAFQWLIPLIYLFAVFYLLRFRPRSKKALKHKALLESLKKGDHVITYDGVHGKVSAVDNELVILDVANNFTIEITKGFIVAINKGHSESCPP
jgi:preprotein translocase subunit YajC